MELSISYYGIQYECFNLLLSLILKKMYTNNECFNAKSSLYKTNIKECD
jgi:hypothetical protein